MRPSVKPHVEVVYFYTELNSDGEDETGYVELKDKRVVSFKSLTLASNQLFCLCTCTNSQPISQRGRRDCLRAHSVLKL